MLGLRSKLSPTRSWWRCSTCPRMIEPVTEDDLEALAEARAEYARGETIPLDVIRCEFGW